MKHPNKPSKHYWLAMRQARSIKHRENKGRAVSTLMGHLRDMLTGDCHG